MQIHDLNTKTLTDPAYVAFDDGADTYKANFKDIIDDAVAEAFSTADVSGGVVNYTSGDAASPTAWSSVSVMTSGSTLAVLLNRISTMIKNTRYLYNLVNSVKTDSNTTIGLIVRLFYQPICPHVMCLRITGTASQKLSVSNGYANLWNANTFITDACGARTSAIIKRVINGSYIMQLYVEQGGLIKIGYARSLVDNTITDISQGTSFYIEEMLFFK